MKTFENPHQIKTAHFALCYEKNQCLFNNFLNLSAQLEWLQAFVTTNDGGRKPRWMWVINE